MTSALLVQRLIRLSFTTILLMLIHSFLWGSPSLLIKAYDLPSHVALHDITDRLYEYGAVVVG